VPTNVTIKDIKFQPADLTIGVGETVTWVDEENVQHTTVSRGSKEWESPLLGQGDHFSHTFTKAGTYPYWCTIHPEMLGTITVR
jgi:plastocyanin